MMDKVLAKITEYALLGKLAADGVVALMGLIERYGTGEATDQDIEREIETIEESISAANIRDRARLTGG